MDTANQNSIDTEALRGEIETLKHQRSAAMDDVAVLVGQISSLRKQLGEVHAKVQSTGTSEDAGATPCAASETTVGTEV